jgi:steroid delta-isomerase-like uncharacterized protein
MAKATKQAVAADSAKPEEVLNPAEVARRVVEGGNTHDPDLVVKYTHPDCVDEFLAVGVFEGRDAIRGFFAELFAAAPDFEIHVDRVAAEGNVAVVQWHASGTFDGGPFQGIEPTGRRIDIRGVDVMDIEDGLVRHNTIYYDGATFARQIGMLPRKDSAADRAVLRAFNATTRARAALRRRRSSTG